MKKDILLFGMQWSGKGTQADLLMEKITNYQYFEPGNIFRALKSNDNVLWKHISSRMKKWEMLDDKITFGLFDIYFHLLWEDEFMLVDGFLRTLNQMYYYLHKMHLSWDRDFIAIYFDISREEALKRLMIRAKKEWREDDNIESINKRIDIYEKETLPVINYLETMGKLIRINAERPIEDIYLELSKTLWI